MDDNTDDLFSDDVESFLEASFQGAFISSILAGLVRAGLDPMDIATLEQHHPLLADPLVTNPLYIAFRRSLEKKFNRGAGLLYGDIVDAIFRDPRRD